MGRWAGLPLTLQVALVCALTASVLALALVAPAPAFARLSWTGPVGQDTAGNGPALIAVACPSSTECVALDVNGGEETFNPSAPATAAPVSIDSSEPLSVACLSATSCVAVDVAGREVSFNPQAPASSAQATTVDPGQVLTSVSCAPGTLTTMPCTAVDANGDEVTFNTVGPPSPSSFQFDSGQVLTAVSCPVQFGCVAVDNNGTAWTFNPESQNPIESSQSLQSQDYLTTVNCTLTSNQCVAFDSNGTEFVFGPGGSGGNSTIPSFDSGHSVAAVACPDGVNCVAIDADGGEISFAPSTTGGNASQSARTVISPNYQPTSLACPLANLCVAVDAAGHELSFDPTASPPVPSSARIDGLPSYSIVSCPAAHQCTGIDAQGNEATFDPRSSGPVSAQGAVDPNGITIYSIACPTTAQCTAVDQRGQEVTFNPATPGTPAPVAIVNNHPLLAISCPSATQCTAVDDDQYEVTFNPQAPTTGRYGLLGTPAQTSITSVACPSVSQCTAVDAVGDEVTFDPQDPGNPKPTIVLPDGAVGVACPMVWRCIAIDPSGERATFDPQAPSDVTTAMVDASQPSALACPAATYCLAIDLAGHAVEFDPAGVAATAVDGVGSGGSLNGLACVSAGECVTVDSTGRAYLGEGPIPPVPAAGAPPRIAGELKQGKMLKETHGSWSGPPTSYSYQWERCTRTSSCRPIPGAVQQSYLLVAADAGHLIRVTEQAADAGGFGDTVLSAATGKVIGLPAAPFLSHIRLSGIAAGHPSLRLKLTASRYGPKLHDWTLSLPHALTVHLWPIGSRRSGRWTGISIRVNGRQKRFSAHVRHGTFAIGLQRSCESLSISIGDSALHAAQSLIRSVRHRKAQRLELTVTVRSATHQLLHTMTAIRTG